METVKWDKPDPTRQTHSGIILIAGPPHFRMDVPNVDRPLDDLRRRKVKILGEPCNIPLIGKRLFFLSDPWGNLIEIAEQLK